MPTFTGRGMGVYDHGIRWDPVPCVAAEPHARPFVTDLRQFAKRPKPIDACARNLAAYLACFDGALAAQWIDADKGAVLTYLEDLRSGRSVPSSRA